MATKKGTKKATAKRAGKRIIGGQSLKGLVSGALALSAVKGAARFIGISQRLGRFQQPAEELTTGVILQASGIGGGADLVGAGAKGVASEGIEMGLNFVTGREQGAGLGGSTGQAGIDFL